MKKLSLALLILCVFSASTRSAGLSVDKAIKQQEVFQKLRARLAQLQKQLDYGKPPQEQMELIQLIIAIKAGLPEYQ